MNKSFVVFSGGNDRAVLGFLRALALCGERAHIVARTRSDRILRTRYQRDVRWIRDDHTLSLDVFRDCISRVREKVGDGPLVVLPSTEYFNTFLLDNRPEIERMNCEIPLVDGRLYARLTGKRTAIDFFSEAGIDAPRELGADALELPVVAKPRTNVSHSRKSLYPQLLQTSSELDAFLRHHNVVEYFFQEFIRGDSLYLLFFLSRSGQQFTWSQRNLLQQPDGKSMLLAEPSDFHRSATAMRILAALRQARFHGLGMVEVIRAGDREAFIEMNPRIWGPVQFCLDQRQPLLQAFIGECLYGDPSRHLDRKPRFRRNRYLWLGGIIETLRTGKQPTWHVPAHNLTATLLFNMAADVYLRKDSWRCFLHDLIHITRPRREQPKN